MTKVGVSQNSPNGGRKKKYGKGEKNTGTKGGGGWGVSHLERITRGVRTHKTWKNSREKTSVIGGSKGEA